MVGRRLRPGSVFSVPLCFIFFDQATGDTRDELETQRRRGHGGRWGDGRQAAKAGLGVLCASVFHLLRSSDG